MEINATNFTGVSARETAITTTMAETEQLIAKPARFKDWSDEYLENKDSKFLIKITLLSRNDSSHNVLTI